MDKIDISATGLTTNCSTKSRNLCDVSLTSLLICLIEQDDVKTAGYGMYSPSSYAETVKMPRVWKLDYDSQRECRSKPTQH